MMPKFSNIYPNLKMPSSLSREKYLYSPYYSKKDLTPTTYRPNKKLFITNATSSANGDEKKSRKPDDSLPRIDNYSKDSSKVVENNL